VLVEIYQRYADGESLADIASDLNERGYRTRQGRLFQTGTFDRIIPNTIYIGAFHYGKLTIPDFCPAIISKELYDRAVARRERNKRAPAAKRATVDYLLSGKLFCGQCGLPMIGDYGTSRHGTQHHYYSCSGRKHKRNDCKKKSEKQDFIEWYVCEQTVDYVLSPSNLDAIAERVVSVYNADIDDTRIKALEAQITRLKDETNKLIDRLIDAPKTASKSIYERMEQVELQRQDIEQDLNKLRVQQKLPLTVSEVRAWLQTFSGGDLMETVTRRQIIDTFVNCVYLYDDKVVIFYNIRGGKQTSAIETIAEIDEKIPGLGSTMTGNSGELLSKVEPLWVFAGGMLGIIIFRH
jgi:hypothetical protein